MAVLTPKSVMRSTQFKNSLFIGMYESSNDCVMYLEYGDMKKTYCFDSVYDDSMVEPVQDWLKKNGFISIETSNIMYEEINKHANASYIASPITLRQEQIALMTMLLLMDDVNKEVVLHEQNSDKIQLVTCLDNSGMEMQFDKGVDYKLVSSDTNEQFIIVEDALCKEVRVFRDRFRIKEKSNVK